MSPVERRALFAQYENLVRIAAASSVGPHATFDDLYQEGAECLLQCIDRFQVGDFQRYVRRALKNRMREVYRRMRIRQVPTVAEDDLAPVPASVEAEPGTHVVIHEALARLTPTERAVFLLRADGATWREISARLGRSRHQLRRPWLRAQRKLRAYLEEADAV
jgi:RNA polymerase sigma factor (sigma-70 family)